MASRNFGRRVTSWLGDGRWPSPAQLELRQLRGYRFGLVFGNRQQAADRQIVELLSDAGGGPEDLEPADCGRIAEAKVLSVAVAAEAAAGCHVPVDRARLAGFVDFDLDAG